MAHTYSYSFWTPTVDISQAKILDQFFSYLEQVGLQEGQARDIYINKTGDCNGYSFLHGYYNAKNSEQEYRDILTYISKWNGNLNYLNNNYDMPSYLQTKYKNGIDLFEQTINDSVWFSHIHAQPITNYEIDQRNRLEQYQMVHDNKLTLEQVYKFEGVTYKFNQSIFPDILKIASKWTESFIDVAVLGMNGGHAVSIYVTAEGAFKYYDCNKNNGSIVTFSSEEVSYYIHSALGNAYGKVYDISGYKFHPKDEAIFDSVHLPNDIQLPADINPAAVETFLDAAVYFGNEFYLHQRDLFCNVYKMVTDPSKLSFELTEKAFFYSAQDGRLDLMSKMLSENSIDIDHKFYKYEGNTALMIASHKGRFEIVELLLKEGANKNLTNNDGASALNFAEMNGHHDIVKLFHHHDKDVLTLNDCLCDYDPIPGLDNLPSATTCSPSQLPLSQSNHDVASMPIQTHFIPEMDASHIELLS